MRLHMVIRPVNWSISTKIVTGFALILTIAGFVTVSAELGLRRADTAFAAYQEISNQGARLAALQEQVAIARLSAREYIAGDDTNRRRFLTALGKAGEILGTARDIAELSRDKVDEALSRLRSGFEHQAAKLDSAAKSERAFNERAIALDEKATTLIALLAAGADVKQQLTLSAATRAILDSRLAAQRFLRSADTEDRLVSERLLHSAENDLEQLAKEPNVHPFAAKIDEVNEQLAELKRDFAAMADDVQAAANAASDEIMPAGSEADRAIAGANAAARSAGQQVGTAAQESSERVRHLVHLASILGLIAGVVLAFTISRTINRPIIALTTNMRRIAAGDRMAQIPAMTRGDEIGEMVEALRTFQARAAGLERSASGFEADAEAAVAVLATAAGELGETASAMLRMADQTRSGATTVATASAQAATNVQSVAEAAEHLRCSVLEIGRHVHRSASITEAAVEQAKQADTKMRGLAGAAQQIDAVVALIQNIAAQTNLLALNATIEAARAGQAGKGFAVVASEVKALANQTASATDDIRAKVAEIHAATTDAVETITSIGKTIAEVSGLAVLIASAVEEQGTAAQDIAQNVQQAAAGTHEVSSNIGDVTRTAGDTREVASRVLHAANDVANQSSWLRTHTERFLASVRAA
jgi:methyl-accepting chemotaxis protein